jgi:hypothetical protein
MNSFCSRYIPIQYVSTDLIVFIDGMKLTEQDILFLLLTTKGMSYGTLKVTRPVDNLGLTVNTVSHS